MRVSKILKFWLYTLYIYTDACPGGSVEFDGQVGVFIDGRIDPPLENVQVLIQSDSTEESKETLTVYSNAQGTYR